MPLLYRFVKHQHGIYLLDGGVDNVGCFGHGSEAPEWLLEIFDEIHHVVFDL